MAGPMANLTLAFVAGIVLRVGDMAGWFEGTNPFDFIFAGQGFPTGSTARGMVLFAILFTLNLILFVFNLLPLPPLDGAAIWPVVLRRRALARYLEFRDQPSFVLLGVIVAASIFPRVFAPVGRVAYLILFWGT
jgi:Zn-dependent protease